MRTSLALAAMIAVGGAWTLHRPGEPLQQQDQYQLSGSRVAVYNLAGDVTVEPGSGSNVVVEVRRGGPDAEQLQIERGPIGDWMTLRVVYPGDRIVFGDYDHGSTELRVRDDGTFSDQYDRRRREEGRRIRISGSGDGLEAFADLRVRVPAGKSFAMYLAVGEVSVSNVNGDLRLDTHSAPVTTDGTSGRLVIDVGSGEVDVSDAEGDVDIDTGSGEVDVHGVRGDLLRIDTGSGEVTADNVSVATLEIDTGSGDVDVDGATARDVVIDTGSGSVDLVLTGDPRDIEIDTGSGDVTLTVPETFEAELEIDTGSGGIQVDFPVQMRQWDRTHVTGVIGNGGARLLVDTGSGDVTIIKG
jgi:lia operon protein LiaG